MAVCRIATLCQIAPHGAVILIEFLKERNVIIAAGEGDRKQVEAVLF